jgi:hypothetical protein
MEERTGQQSQGHTFYKQQSDRYIDGTVRETRAQNSDNELKRQKQRKIGEE